MKITDAENIVIKQAMSLLEERMKYTSDINFTSPGDTRKFLKLSFAGLEREVFKVLFLDTRHRLIKAEDMFLGTVDGASVHPREVVKRALELNAVALILAHNHPSGDATPSASDKGITRRLIDACALLEIRILDHFIIGKEIVSFAESGLI